MVPEFRTAEATSSTSNTPHPTAEGVLDAPIRAAYEEIQTLHKLARTEWKANRRAVIHTVDVSSHYSQHAEKIFSSFRRGIYVGDADFHVNDVGEWLDQQMSIRDLKSSEPTFLSHAILDLPGSHDHVEKVASALHPDGVLIVFNPSITQILRSIKMIREKKIPLWLDRVVELGAGLTGGREWDVRTARPRASLRAEKARTEAQAVKGLGTSEETNVLGITNEGPMQSAKQDQEHIELLRPERSGFETICRPKVGERITGGGFLGVWRKMKSLDTSATAKSNV
ncbi:hypothetical protein MMC19_003292 [Ptychographa xylographoides]|nr:hypothetical protein [Ptychographa xylographoides]